MLECWTELGTVKTKHKQHVTAPNHLYEFEVIHSFFPVQHTHNPKWVFKHLCLTILLIRKYIIFKKMLTVLRNFQRGLIRLWNMKFWYITMQLIIYYKFFTNTNKRTFKIIKNDKVHVSESHQIFLFLPIYLSLLPKKRL